MQNLELDSQNQYNDLELESPGFNHNNNNNNNSNLLSAPLGINTNNSNFQSISNSNKLNLVTGAANKSTAHQDNNQSSFQFYDEHMVNYNYGNNSTGFLLPFNLKKQENEIIEEN